MALTNAYLPKLASRLFSASNGYGLGTTATAEVTSASYRRKSGSEFAWMVNSEVAAAPYAYNTSAVYYPELSGTEAYSANYFLIYAVVDNLTQLVYNAAFQSPAASVTAGQQVKIAAFVADAQRGVKVTFTL